MPLRFWIVLGLSLLAGLMVLRATPRGGKRPPSAKRWRGQIKPVPPPPIPLALAPTDAGGACSPSARRIPGLLL
jgi:hypothetical protein